MAISWNANVDDISRFSSSGSSSMVSPVSGVSIYMRMVIKAMSTAGLDLMITWSELEGYIPYPRNLSQ